MNTPVPPRIPKRRIRPLAIVFLILLALLLISAAGVASYFRLSSEATALRRSVLSSVQGQWEKKFAINVGFFTTALVRCGSLFFDLPREPRAAISSLRGVEVGVYNLVDKTPARVDQRALLASADKAMLRRGWERVVGVAKPGELVGIYMPRRGVSLKYAECCLVVWHDRELVVASVRGNLEPLMEIANEAWAREVAPKLAKKPSLTIGRLAAAGKP